MDALSAAWRLTPLEPFETETVLVSSTGAGRILSQQLALALGANQGICAGAEFLTLQQYRRRLAERAGIPSGTDPWRTRPLSFTICSLLEDLLHRPDFSVVAHHLGQRHDQNRPGRWLGAANRFARVLLRYADQCPEMLRRWSACDPVDPTGAQLDGEYRWQYDLWLELESAIPVPSPVHRNEVVAGHVPTTGRLQLFAPAELSQLDKELLAAISAEREIISYLIGDEELESCPTLVLHPSHGPARQVEVLRDALCGVFEDHPDIQPRDVIIFCSDLARYAPLLEAAFSEVTSHPAGELRLQLSAGAGRQRNEVLQLLVRLLRLPQGRALASDLLDLCALEPVAYRFGFDDEDISRLRELLEQANVRWGIDLAHRKNQFDLPIIQNTWLSGIDQLLSGLTMPGSELHWIGTVLPSDAASSSDADLLGRVAELISRIRRFCHLTAAPRSVSSWTELLRETVQLFADTPYESSWMLHQTWAELTALAEGFGSNAQMLSRIEMATVLDQALSRPAGRPAYGNGALLVTTPGDLAHVPHRVVCLIGPATPRNRDYHGDSLPLPQPGGAQLWETIRVAEQQAIIVYQGAHEQSGRRLSRPILLDLIETEATARGWSIRTDPQHALHPYGRREFEKNSPFSFDQRMFVASTAAQSPSQQTTVTIPAASKGPVSMDALALLMRNAAQFFRTYRLNLPIQQETPVERGLPLDVQGLARWTIGDRMLSLIGSGADPGDVMQAEWRRGTVGPGEIGRRTLEGIGREVQAIAGHASALRIGDPKEHLLSVEVDGRVISGTATEWEGVIVTSTFSKTDDKVWLSAWLQIVIAAAAGLPVRRAHAIGRADWSRDQTALFTERIITGPPQERAREILGDLLLIHDEALCSVPPLPMGVALPYAQRARVLRTPMSRSEISDRFGRRWQWAARGGWADFYQDLDHLLAEPSRSGRQSCRFAELADCVFGPIIRATQVVQHG